MNNKRNAKPLIRIASLVTVSIISTLALTSIAHSDTVKARAAIIKETGAWFDRNYDDGESWEMMTSPDQRPIAVAVDSNYMGLVTKQGAMYRPNDSSRWIVIRPNDEKFTPTDIAVSDNGRLAFIDEYDGAHFRACDDCSWQVMASADQKPIAVAVSGDYMGLVTKQGAVYRPNDSSRWIVIRPNDEKFTPTDIAVSDNGRLAFIDEYDGAHFRACDDCSWQVMASAEQKPVDVAVSGNRMGLITKQGTLFRFNDTSRWLTMEPAEGNTRAIALADGERRVSLEEYCDRNPWSYSCEDGGIIPDDLID